MKVERKEALLRIPIGIVCGIISELWGSLVVFIAILNWFYTIFKAKRSKTLAEFCNVYLNYLYRFVRYMTFATNQRPFPFNELPKEIEKVDMKSKNFT